MKVISHLQIEVFILGNGNHSFECSSSNLALLPQYQGSPNPSWAGEHPGDRLNHLISETTFFFLKNQTNPNQNSELLLKTLGHLGPKTAFHFITATTYNEHKVSIQKPILTQTYFPVTVKRSVSGLANPAHVALRHLPAPPRSPALQINTHYRQRISFSTTQLRKPSHVCRERWLL